MSTKNKKKIYKKTIINNIKNATNDNVPQFSDILSIPSNPEDIFTLISPIGHGAFGSVYKAIHNSSKKIYAIKIIQYFKEEQNLLSNINHMENINFCYKTVQEETSLMRLVNSSDYIVKYYGSYFSRQTNTLWLILEYCASGSVIDLMLAMDKTFTEIEIATIIKMVLQGLILIHSKNLIHRDIKGSNILLSEDGFAKIADFGVGVKLNNNNFRKSKKGSPYWMSPQVVLNEEYGTGTDIWSLGITCLELINGEPPNSSLKPIEVMEKIGKRTLNFEELFGPDNNYSEDFKNFVKKCLVIEEKDRASAKELIKHKFIVKKAKDNKIMKELYRKHINDLEDYRKEVEEYEMEVKMKQKKEREEQIIIQKQRQLQNMSIKYDSEDNKEESNNINNITKNALNKTNDDELLYNKSINSLFLSNLNNNRNCKTNDLDLGNVNNNYDEIESSLLINDSIKYIDNISKLPQSKVIILGSPSEKIFDDNKCNNNNNNNNNIIKERYPNTCSNNINKKSEYVNSDIVNQSSNIHEKRDLNNKSIKIKQYTLESNYSNNTNKNKNNIIKDKSTSDKKNKIKCRIINFNRPMISRQKNTNSSVLNKTMDYKRDNSYDINKKLLLSFNNSSKNADKNINEINKGKSENIMNQIKSLSIVNNNDIMKNKNKQFEIKRNNIDNIHFNLEGEGQKYIPILDENNNTQEENNIKFKNFINKSNSHKQLKKNEKEKNKLNITTDNSNTYDNSNSNFTTNNISNNHSFITNNNSYMVLNPNLDKNKNKNNSINIKNAKSYSNVINTEKNNSQNITNIENRNSNNYFEMSFNDKNKKTIGEFNEIDNNNSHLSNSIEEIVIKNTSCNKKEKSSSFCCNTKLNEEDIYDSDDDGQINNINNRMNNPKDVYRNIIENKENVDKNTINDDNTIENHSVHSYSVVDSIEFLHSIHQKDIFSNAHKKYFS